MEYGQFCPIAKASEILGEKWTILIIRELLMGGTRFNELHRGLSRISPTLLSRRLDTLEDLGLVLKKRLPGQRGFQYLPTDACRELTPVIQALADWGLCWARSNLREQDYDVELLMLYLKRSIVPEKLAGGETVIHFRFTDVKAHARWWILVRNQDVDLCVSDPGKDVDVWFTTTVRTMVDIWMGDTTYRHALRSGALTLVGPTALTRHVTDWMRNSGYADLPSARRI